MTASNTRKVIKGVSSQALVTIVLGLLEIVSFSIMSRLLTPEDFGYYAAISAIVVIFASFSETGIGSALIQKKEIDKQYIDCAFSISLLFGIVISLALVASSGLLSKTVVDGKIAKPLMFMSVVLLANCLSSINISILQRNLRFLTVGLVHIIASITSTIVAVVMALKGLGFYSIVAKSIVSALLVLIVSYFLAGNKYSFHLDKDNFKSIFGFSGWLMASVVFRNISKQADKIVMPRLLSVIALGEYNRPKEFLDQISVKVNGIFDTALFPVLSSIQDDKEELAKSYKRSLYYLNILATLLAIGIAFNARLILVIFFGKDWVYLTGLMMILSIAVLFNADGRLADCFLRSLAMTKQQFIFRAVEAVTKIIAVFIGSKWGLFGVATAVVISESLMRLIKVTYVSHKLSISTSSVFFAILQSWRFCIFLVPFCFFLDWLLPDLLGYEIIKLLLMCLAVLCIFLLMPGLVGDMYRSEVYNKLCHKLFGKY